MIAFCKMRWLCHPIGILAATVLTSDALGADILASLVVWMIDHNYAGIFAHDGMYGTVSGLADLVTIIRRIFGIGSWMFFYVPYSVIALIVWGAISVRAGRLVTQFTRRQRWIMVMSMLVLPTLAFFFELSRLPNMILFTGPLNGFHPLTPAMKTSCAVLTPIVFWLLVDWWDRVVSDLFP